MDYKNTLHLPETKFPMKASLPQQEPRRVEFWSKSGIYEKLLAKNKGAPKFILHDGPPYANGPIHFGHILNKVLKDIIIKQKNMAGLYAPYVPGWDCHGLPIELGALKVMGEKEKDTDKLKDPVTRRRYCREYALKFVDEQREQFKRLGIFGDWDNAYLTLTNRYEADIAREFMDLYLKGYVTLAHKPVHFCVSCKTALAEAEVEYEEVESPSIYVKFALHEPETLSPLLRGKKVTLVIWTTTPWTLPANVGLAVGEKITYDAILSGGEVLIVASPLKGDFLKTCGLPENAQTLQVIEGEDIAEMGLTAAHPFLKRDSKVVAGHHVTTDAGCGIVHIAPGHGQDDFIIGQKTHLPTLCPVGANGAFFDDPSCFASDVVRFPEVRDWLGKFVLKANREIVALLAGKGLLLSPPDLKLRHTYPHCWRCKNPIIYRATEQWFCALEHQDLRGRALKAINDQVQWIPTWGRDRIYGMIENRPDWCLSRQRVWGVPITLHRTEDGEVILDEEVRDHIVAAFEKEGADAWWKTDAPLLPTSALSKHAGKSIKKESSILDVWFDSGVSHAAVLERDPNLVSPADLYLEGSDQHRGWFHSSLLTSMATRDRPPYKAVLTHGFVVDGQGHKYSKSAKNYVPPERILSQLGAELLRLWVAAEDYRDDIRVSDEIIKVLAEVYRKIRNTCRFILGNLADFDPQKRGVPYESRHELDQYALHLLNDLVTRINQAYDNYEFHVVHHALNKFFTVDLSAFYLDVLKDRLYCDTLDSPRRRSSQSTIYDILATTLPLMAPILSFTAEEIWSYVPHKQQTCESVFLLPWPRARAVWKRPDLAERYERIMGVREDILKQLERARRDKLIGHGLDARVTLCAGAENKALLMQYENEWTQILIVSQAIVTHFAEEGGIAGTNCPDVRIRITRAEGKKCERCWNYSLEVGQDGRHPGLCRRCVGACVRRSKEKE